MKIVVEEDGVGLPGSLTYTASGHSSVYPTQTNETPSDLYIPCLGTIHFN